MARLTFEQAQEKYRIEREKRLNKRPEGNAQYKELKGDYEEFDRDPFADPNFTRDARIEEVDVVVVGGGFGGMLTGSFLTKKGIRSFRIIEKAADFGGTWYWNRYPNCACDVESYIYLPLLEETGYMPKEKYSKATEIFAYCQLLGRHFDLYSNALFQTECEDMRWDEASKRWITKTSRGDVLTSKFVVIAGGVLHKAKLPGIKGIEKFKGRKFHTSRWDYSYTGGAPQEKMEKLADKRVGIIGTGATAVQVVPKLGESAKELYVFQRTAASVGIRNNKVTDPEWFKSLKPGWQMERMRNFTQVVTGGQPEVDMIDDAWTKMLWVDTKAVPKDDADAERMDRIDYENMEGIRARIEEVVKDPETAEKLKPWYGQSCKRPCFHDEYLPTFNRPNVHLVDTEGQGVDEITETGVVVNGVEYPVDLLVFASGFEVTSEYHHRLGFDPVGKGAIPLSEAWADGPGTLHGVLGRGFPNMLMISATQGGQAINFVHTITETAIHITHLIERALNENIATFEPTVEAQDAWFNVLIGTVWGTARYNAACTPGYLNNEGGVGTIRSGKSSSYMTSALEFVDILEQWRAAGNFPGYEVTKN